jgi:hypothetical protein
VTRIPPRRHRAARGVGPQHGAACRPLASVALPVPALGGTADATRNLIFVAAAAAVLGLEGEDLADALGHLPGPWDRARSPQRRAALPQDRNLRGQLDVIAL